MQQASACCSYSSMRTCHSTGGNIQLHLPADLYSMLPGPAECMRMYSCTAACAYVSTNTMTTYLHAYIHACIPTYLPTCLHTYCHTKLNLRTYMTIQINQTKQPNIYTHTCMLTEHKIQNNITLHNLQVHTYVHTYMHASARMQPAYIFTCIHMYKQTFLRIYYIHAH